MRTSKARFRASSWAWMDEAQWDIYASGVQAGRIVAGLYVRQAVARYITMRSDARFDFDAAAVGRIVRFFSMLRHFQGRHAGKPFVLQPWQQFIIAAVYGFRWSGTRRRVVRTVYIEMARKQGKTALAAGLSLYHELADGEAAPEVYLAANSRDQAKVAFRMCHEFARSIDPRERLIKRYRDQLLFPAARGMLRVLAADATKLDGPNPSMFLLDEYHAARDSALKDVLQSGQGMRDNPMQVIITTAGFDKLGPCYAMRTACCEVLAGAKDDPALFAGIWTADEGDDWRDESTWVKSNPNLGVTVQPDFLREQVTKAENMPSEEVGVRTKNFNTWCDAETIWIPTHYVDDAAAKGRGYNPEPGAMCYAGIDLSATSDLTALSLLFPDIERGVAYFAFRYYLPEAALQEKRFRILYGEWRRAGWLTVTPGNVTDYDFILADLMRAADGYTLMGVGYDAWNATQFVINATERGLPMKAFSQSTGNFNRPTKEMERMLLSGVAALDDNGVTRHCFRNVVLARDRNGNTKPTKQFDEKKIDGVIAALTALGVYLESPRYGDFF